MYAETCYVEQWECVFRFIRIRWFLNKRKHAYRTASFVFIVVDVRLRDLFVMFPSRVLSVFFFSFLSVCLRLISSWLFRLTPSHYDYIFMAFISPYNQIFRLALVDVQSDAFPLFLLAYFLCRIFWFAPEVIVAVFSPKPSNPFYTSLVTDSKAKSRFYANELASNRYRSEGFPTFQMWTLLYIRDFVHARFRRPDRFRGYSEFDRHTHTINYLKS